MRYNLAADLLQGQLTDHALEGELRASTTAVLEGLPKPSTARTGKW